MRDHRTSENVHHPLAGLTIREALPGHHVCLSLVTEEGKLPRIVSRAVYHRPVSVRNGRSCHHRIRPDVRVVQHGLAVRMALPGEVLEVAVRAAVLDRAAETSWDGLVRLGTLHCRPSVVVHLRDEDFRIRVGVDDPPLRLAAGQAARHFSVAFDPVRRTTGGGHPPLARHLHASLVPLGTLQRFFTVVRERGIRKRQPRIWICWHPTGGATCWRRRSRKRRRRERPHPVGANARIAARVAVCFVNQPLHSLQTLVLVLRRERTHVVALQPLEIRAKNDGPTRRIKWNRRRHAGDLERRLLHQIRERARVFPNYLALTSLRHP